MAASIELALAMYIQIGNSSLRRISHIVGRGNCTPMRTYLWTKTLIWVTKLLKSLHTVPLRGKTCFWSRPHVAILRTFWYFQTGFAFSAPEIDAWWKWEVVIIRPSWCFLSVSAGYLEPHSDKWRDCFAKHFYKLYLYSHWRHSIFFCLPLQRSQHRATLKMQHSGLEDATIVPAFICWICSQ